MAGESKQLSENVIFIIVTITFFGILVFFLSALGTNDSSFEQTTAKNIALVLDNAKPDTEIYLDISEFLFRAEKNKFSPVIEITEGKVFAKLKEGKGYSFNYFTQFKINYELNKDTRQLIIKLT